MDRTTKLLGTRGSMRVPRVCEMTALEQFPTGVLELLLDEVLWSRVSPSMQNRPDCQSSKNREVLIRQKRLLSLAVRIQPRTPSLAGRKAQKPIYLTEREILERYDALKSLGAASLYPDSTQQSQV
jgi:hypothetical protein